jgi:hypothetical protein
MSTLQRIFLEEVQPGRRLILKEREEEEWQDDV